MNALTLAALSDSAAAKAVADDALTQVEGVSTAVATAEAAATAAQTAAEGAQTDAQSAIDTADQAIQNGVSLTAEINTLTSVVSALDTAVTAADAKATEAKTASDAATLAAATVATDLTALSGTVDTVSSTATDAAAAAVLAQNAADNASTAVGTLTTSLATTQAEVVTAQAAAAAAQTDATSALDGLATIGNYKKEIHLDPVNGIDTNNGTVGKPIKTLAKMLTLLDNSGLRVVLHPGTYAEACTVSALNVTFEGLTAGGALINLTADWVFSHASSSIRVGGIAFTNLRHTGAGGLYLAANTYVRGLLTKSGAGYFESRHSDLQGTGISVTGAGYFNAFNCKTLGLNVNNPAAIATVVSSENTVSPVAVAGVLQLINNIVFAMSETAPAVSGASGATVILSGNKFYTPTGASARISLQGAHSYSGDVFDLANSTLSTANLGTVAQYDALRTKGGITAGGALTAIGAIVGASVAVPWVQANAYAAGVWVDNAGVLARSNAAIPAGTAWTLGTTGATWKAIAGGGAGVVVTFQSDSNAFPADGVVGDIVLVTTDGTANGAVLEYWICNDSPVWLKVSSTPPVTSGAVLDNTNGDSASYTIKGRYIVPAADQVDSYFLGRSGQYADWDGIKFTFSTPANGAKAVINSGVNAGQTWVYTTATTTWAKVDDGLSQVSLYDQTKAYAAAKSLVVKDLVLYKPNSDIPANTAFAEGADALQYSRIGAKARAVITKISQGGSNGMLIVADGRLYCARGTEGNGAWAAAQSADGRIASLRNSIGNAYEITIPNAVVGTTVVDAGVINTAAWALMSNGDLFVWGNNANGNLGLGDTAARYLPVRTRQNVSKVFTHHSQEQRSFDFQRMFIQTTDGKVWCCGYNGQGQCGFPNTTATSSWLEVTAAGLFPKSVWVMGSYIGFTLIQKADGNVIIAGYGRGGGGLGIGLVADTTAFVSANVWIGNDVAYTIKQVEAGLGFNDASPNDQTNMSVLSDNGANSKLLGCGTNSWGTLGVGAFGTVTTPLSPLNVVKRIKKIVRMGDAPGSLHMLTYDGELWSCGRGGQGVLGQGAVGGDKHTPALAETGVTDIYQLSTSAGYGYETTSPIILKNDGFYYSCGWGGVGLNAYGGTQNLDLYNKMAFPRSVKLKAFGQFSTYINRFTRFAVSDDNRIYGWGYGANYNLEENSTINNFMPVDVTPKVFSA